MGRSVNSFKGFEPEEIIILYKYICWYKSISKISTDKKLYKQYPWTKSFWIDTSIKKYNFKIEKSSKMPKKAIEQRSNTMVYTKSVGTKLLSFLRHLRNSIAHGNIEARGKGNNVVTICDYYSNGSKCSCMGNLHKTLLIDLLIKIQL